MKKVYLSVLALVNFIVAVAQPTIPANPATCNSSNCTSLISGTPWDVCSPGSTTFVSNMSTNPTLASGSALSAGAVYRFPAIGSVGAVTINATITVDVLSNANLVSIDDNTASAIDQAGNSVVTNFSPRIQPNAVLNAATRGYVQFTIRFYNAALGNGYATLFSLASPTFVHYDNDGNGNTANWFRETGVTQRLSPSNPFVLAAGGGTSELVAYNYSQGADAWTGFAGSVCERTNISKCAEVAGAYRFNTNLNTITFRLGYDYRGGNGGGQPTRQYATRFTCFGPSQGTLPLSVTQFAISHKLGKATLYWTSVDEQKFKNFVVERSTNARDFIPVSTVAARGAGRASTDYQFIDDVELIASTTIYYRLKMVDEDGKYIYSTIVSLRKGLLGNKLNISPNPANNNAVIRFKAERSGSADIFIADITGRIVFQKKTQFMAGDNNILIPEIVSLVEGIYSIKLVYGGETINDRLVIKR